MRKLILIGAMGILAACSKNELSPAEMVQWAEAPDNELVYTKTLNGVEYRLQYMPAGYLALREQGTLNHVNREQFSRRLNELEQYHHFKLRMRIPGVNADPLLYGISDQQEYTQRDMFYGFEFREHIKKVEKSDTSACQLYQFVQHHGLAPYADIVFAFKKDKTEKDFQVVFDDPVFNNGFMKYTFTRDEMEQVPEVEI